MAAQQADPMRQSRRLGAIDATSVIQTVAKFYGVKAEDYRVRRSSAAGRDLAAYLAHRHTTATLRELTHDTSVT